MPRDDAITFGDLVGKLGHLEFVCSKCSKRGGTFVPRLADRYGADGRIQTWLVDMTRDCPRWKSPEDLCAAHCPDLSKVV
jgi:hypothetical protein